MKRPASATTKGSIFCIPKKFKRFASYRYSTILANDLQSNRENLSTNFVASTNVSDQLIRARLPMGEGTSAVKQSILYPGSMVTLKIDELSIETAADDIAALTHSMAITQKKTDPGNANRLFLTMIWWGHVECFLTRDGKPPFHKIVQMGVATVPAWWCPDVTNAPRDCHLDTYINDGNVLYDQLIPNRLYLDSDRLAQIRPIWDAAPDGTLVPIISSSGDSSFINLTDGGYILLSSPPTQDLLTLINKQTARVDLNKFRWSPNNKSINPIKSSQLYNYLSSIGTIFSKNVDGSLNSWGVNVLGDLATWYTSNQNSGRLKDDIDGFIPAITGMTSFRHCLLVDRTINFATTIDKIDLPFPGTPFTCLAAYMLDGPVTTNTTLLKPWTHMEPVPNITIYEGPSSFTTTAMLANNFRGFRACITKDTESDTKTWPSISNYQQVPVGYYMSHEAYVTNKLSADSNYSTELMDIFFINPDNMAVQDSFGELSANIPTNAMTADAYPLYRQGRFLGNPLTRYASPNYTTADVLMFLKDWKITQSDIFFLTRILSNELKSSILSNLAKNAIVTISQAANGQFNEWANSFTETFQVNVSQTGYILYKKRTHENKITSDVNNLQFRVEIQNEHGDPYPTVTTTATTLVSVTLTGYDRSLPNT